jgi:hypothetical protein
MKNLEEGTRVTVRGLMGLDGMSGCVRGIAMDEPGVTVYLVQFDNILDPKIYPYTVVAIPEMNLQVG